MRMSDSARSINAVPYWADYFGHKLHIDQNEKLVMYGASHVTAIDGHSRFVVAATTIPVKNNVITYERLEIIYLLFSLLSCFFEVWIISSAACGWRS